MTHSEFRIGEDFWCGDRRWRCTDVGTRVIVAICLESHEIVEMNVKKDDARPLQRRIVSDDPSWLTGPPYAINEEVFDEDAVLACSREKTA